MCRRYRLKCIGKQSLYIDVFCSSSMDGINSSCLQFRTVIFSFLNWFFHHFLFFFLHHDFTLIKRVFFLFFYSHFDTAFKRFCMIPTSFNESHENFNRIACFGSAILMFSESGFQYELLCKLCIELEKVKTLFMTVIFIDSFRSMQRKLQ